MTSHHSRAMNGFVGLLPLKKLKREPITLSEYLKISSKVSGDLAVGQAARIVR